MSHTLKRFFKWFVPLPVRVYEWGIDRVLFASKETQKQIGEVSRSLQEERKRSEALAIEWKAERQRSDALQMEMREEKDRIQAEKKQLEEMAAGLREAARLIQAGNRQADAHRKISEEMLWGQIFNNATQDSDWLKSRTFSPGRWAVGYPGLYLLYRILNDVRPRRILELGLGETTKMIGQYAASRPDCEHVVVEHDPGWIAFCQKEIKRFSPQTTLLRLELARRAHLDDAEVIVYDRFRETFEGRKFDLILIDGPFGGKAEKYARIDILDLLPDCLADPFVIVMDDFERVGEKNTVALIEQKLAERRIPFFKGNYAGQKVAVVVCSETLKFLRSV